jgi:hypothetical protein
MWVAVFVVVGTLGAMAADGPAATNSPTSAADGEKAKVVIDQSSAKAAVETLARAFKAHDGVAMAACLPPEYKDIMGPMFVAAMDVVAKGESLKKTVVAKFGKEAADAALKGSPAEGMMNSGPFEGCLNADGTIDWTKVKLTEEGDAATLQLEGKGTKETLKKVNGKWCMDLKDMTPEKAKKDGEQASKMMKAMGGALADVEKQVNDGKVGKDDLQKTLQDAVMKVMMEVMKDAGPNAAPGN